MQSVRPVGRGAELGMLDGAALTKLYDNKTIATQTCNQSRHASYGRPAVRNAGQTILVSVLRPRSIQGWPNGPDSFLTHFSLRRMWPRRVFRETPKANSNMTSNCCASRRRPQFGESGAGGVRHRNFFNANTTEYEMTVLKSLAHSSYL